MGNTLGEQRVRVEFNPSNDDGVHQIKEKSASLINSCEGIKQTNPDDSEVKRLVELAQDKYEEAAMYAVKAATANL